MRSSMCSHPSSRRATSRASKKIGGSENFDDDGDDGKASPVGFGFSVGTSGDAGEMIGSIYRIFTALQVDAVSTEAIMSTMGGSKWTYAPQRRRLSVRLNVQPLRPFSSCEPSTSDEFVRAASRAMISWIESMLM